jgi:hypothetical protein
MLLLLASPQGAPEPPIDVRASASVVADAVVKQDANELRPQLAALVTMAPSTWFTARADATVEALVSGRETDITALELRVRDVWAEARGRWGDIRGGWARLNWGRLDELSPADVVNPLDAAKFVFEGRSEARLAVPLVRARFLPSDRLTIEGVYSPRLVRGTYDLLDEETSPFNLTRDIVLPAGIDVLAGREHVEQTGPGQFEPLDYGVASGGARVLGTIGRVDVGLSTYRGVDGFGPVLFQPLSASIVPGVEVVGQLVELHPRFVMYAADFETVSGPWAWRGEAAYFSERTFAATTFPGTVPGTSFASGLGFDRRAGPLRVFGTFLMQRESAPLDGSAVRTDYTLVGSVDRTFNRDRMTVRAFVATNPADQSGFVRGIFLWKARDRVALEVSGGAFLGTSDDLIGRFEGRDFVAGKLRVDLR